MDRQWPMFCALPFLVLLLLLMAASPAVACSSVISESKFWESEVQATQWPPSLIDRVSALSPESLLRFLWYMKMGILPSFGNTLCKAANLECDPNAGFWNEEAGERNNTLKISEVFVGNQMSVPDLRSHLPHRAFLPRILSSKLPFDKESLPALLQMFQIPSPSPLAYHMQRTLSLCEEMASQAPPETVTCATSMEEMVQFATGRLGSSDVEVLQPSMMMSGEETMSVTGFTARERRRVVNCRELMFPYSVFLCEATEEKMQTVEVDLEGRNGEGKGIVQCRSIVIGWCRVEVCEWVSEERLLWVVKEQQQEEEMKWMNEKTMTDSGADPAVSHEP